MRPGAAAPSLLETLPQPARGSERRFPLILSSSSRARHFHLGRVRDAPPGLGGLGRSTLRSLPAGAMVMPCPRLGSPSCGPSSRNHLRWFRALSHRACRAGVWVGLRVLVRFDGTRWSPRESTLPSPTLVLLPSFLGIVDPSQCAQTPTSWVHPSPLCLRPPCTLTLGLPGKAR